MMLEVGVHKIIQVLKSKNYKVFENDSKPFNINIVGVRSKDMTPDVYNDAIFLFWKYNGQWSKISNKATTDPGLYWLKDPENIGNKKGAFILKEGQYSGMWKVGLHKGEPAFQQIGKCTGIRDIDRDDEMDLNGVEDTGLFGINGHNSNNFRESLKVGKYSAGCQVWANPHEHHVSLESAKQALNYWNNSFTYTLINEKDCE